MNNPSLEKHVKEDVVSSVKAQKDDSLMLLDYINKGDVKIDNDLLTSKINVNDYFL